MSERDPEMIERVQKALDDELDFYAFLAPTRAQITSACVAFARAEVRRALVAELERLSVSTCNHIVEETATDRGVNVHVGHVTRIIDARLRELRDETEQGPGSSPRASDTAQTAAKDAGSTPAPGTYYAVRNLLGSATAICRDGKAIIIVAPGAYPNEDGGVDAILAALNKPDLSDADVLERAAELMEEAGMWEAARWDMIERVQKALDDELDFYDSMAPTRAQITSACASFARDEVRRALVEELEKIEPMSIADEINYIDARLRELRGETEQGPCAATVADSTEQRAQGSDEAGGSIPPTGATLRERAERLLVFIPEPTFRKWAVDNAVALANDEADRAAQEMEAKMDEELHAVRMEAQTLREANEAWSFANGKLIGWIKWRQAWTGGNDPRDLSGTRWDICALRGDAPPRGFEARPGSSPTTETPVVKAGQTMHVGTDRSLLVHFAQTAAKDAGSTPAGTYMSGLDLARAGEERTARQVLPAPVPPVAYSDAELRAVRCELERVDFATTMAVTARINELVSEEERRKQSEVSDPSVNAATPAPAPGWIEMWAGEWYGPAWNPLLKVDVRLAAFLRARLEPVDAWLRELSENEAFTASGRDIANHARSLLRGEVRP